MLTFSSIKAKIATLSDGCLLMSAMVLVGWSLVGGRQTGDFVQQKTETLLNKNAENHLGAIANANRHAISGLNLESPWMRRVVSLRPSRCWLARVPAYRPQHAAPNSRRSWRLC
jgi:hypothetical protein